MNREWKPGDVARVRYESFDQVGIVRPRRAAQGRLEVAYLNGGYDMVSSLSYSEISPLVVIDPEDREQVERLAARFHNEFQGQRRVIEGGYVDAMRAALREFADRKPPRPEEPTGLGAVVEDAKGQLWFRMTLENQTYPGEVWQEQYGGDADRWGKWDDIDVVRVLSEGVNP